MDRRREPLVLEEHAVNRGKCLQPFSRSGQCPLDPLLRGHTRLMIDPMTIIEPFEPMIPDYKQIRNIYAFQHIIDSTTSDDPGHIHAMRRPIESIPGTIVKHRLRRSWSNAAKCAVEIGK